MADRTSRDVPSGLAVTSSSSERAVPTTGSVVHRRVRRRMPRRLYPLVLPSLALPAAIPPMSLLELAQPNMAEQPTGLVLPRVFVDSSAPERLVGLSSPAFETRLPEQHNDHSSVADSQVDYVDTTFSEQVRLPLFRLWSGHLEFGAFDIDRSMDTILLGPQSTGGLVNLSNILLPTHQGRIKPVDEVSYGMVLSFRLRGHSEWGPHIHGWKCLGWALGSGRGCRLN